MIARFNGREKSARYARTRYGSVATLAAVLILMTLTALATDLTSPVAPINATPASPMPAMTSATSSLFRVLGAFALVLALFFGGVWLFRNWQRLAAAKGHAPKLNILETRSLGQRHALYVVSYEQQRILISASPSGVTMLTTLPNAPGTPAAASAAPAQSFAASLHSALERKS